MKIIFTKMINAPIWWEVGPDPRLHYRDDDLDSTDITNLIDLLVAQFPSVRYKLCSDINYFSYKDRETKERLIKVNKGKLRFEVCFGSKHEQAYFIVWASDGIEI